MFEKENPRNIRKHDYINKSISTLIYILNFETGTGSQLNQAQQVPISLVC